MSVRHLFNGLVQKSMACSVLWLLSTATPAADPAPVHATWTALPIRLVADQLSRLAGMPVVLDRRIDPTTSITLVVAGKPFGEALTAVAALAGGQAVRLESTIRIMPPAEAGRCLTAEQTRRREISRLPTSQRGPLSTKAAWQWPAGSRPRDLVVAAAAEAGIVVVGLDRVPHDHFPAADLPPLALAERIDLILAHFDLRASWSRTPTAAHPRCQLVPLPAAMPNGEVAAAPAAPPRQTSPPRQAGERQTYTLRLEAPLEEALAAITRQLGLVLDLDKASLSARGIAPREIVRAVVRSASRDQLLDAILAPLGLAWQIDDATLRVWAEPSPR